MSSSPGPEELSLTQPFPALVRPPLVGGLEPLGVGWIAAAVAFGLGMSYVSAVNGSLSLVGLAGVVLPLLPGLPLIRRLNRRDAQFLAVWLRAQRYAKAYQPRAYLYASPARRPRTL